jgi:sugar transferase (PEP-CTERM/EpsH1 system associated)
MRVKPLNDQRPLVAHILYRFDTGGLENGVVNLINHMPAEHYRHAIIALTEITDFRKRITRDDVEFIALNKKPGHGFWLYPKLFKLFREKRPTIVHTRNLAALEVTVPAWAAGVPIRIHSEHGREGQDLDPQTTKFRLLRKLYRPFVTYYLALSSDLRHYLHHYIGVPEDKLAQIYNGVDTYRFADTDVRQSIFGCPFQAPEYWMVGTIGRMHAVKDQMNLAKGFVRALEARPELRNSLRLIMIGDGPHRTAVQQFLSDAGVADISWLPGERQDIPEILRGLDCFVLPSRSEGISNTILEAMASGLPVIATEVGGNPELVDDEITGKLVPPDSPAALAAAIINYACDRDAAARAGESAMRTVKQRFSLDTMVSAYSRLYDKLLDRTQPADVT